MVKALICDDIAGRAARLAAHIQSVPGIDDRVQVRVAEESELLSSISTLRQRRDQARLDVESASAPTHEPSPRVLPAEVLQDTVFDGMDLVILDYDLFWLGIDRADGTARQMESARLTGEQLAYLVRCYSSAKYVIAVNQFGENVFDLRLRGHLSSYADLNIGGTQLSNPGLWGATWLPSFRPWQWPDVLSAPDLHQLRTEFVMAHWDVKILDAFGLADITRRALLDRGTIGFLGRGGAAATFRQFAESGKPGTLDLTDRISDDVSLAALVASRLHKWLEREILSGQEAIVDGPHLVERYPSVLLGDPSIRASYNLVTNLDVDASYEELGIQGDDLTPAEFLHPFWLSRRAWYGNILTGQRRVAEIADPFRSPTSEFRFCEDVSQFLPAVSTLDFGSEVRSTYVRRYVAGPRGMSLADEGFPELYEGANGIVDVEYVPFGMLEE